MIPQTAGENDAYFEDDSEYEDYPGCSSSAPPLTDPLLLLNPNRLDGRYPGSWPNHDELLIRGTPGDEQTPAVAYINSMRVPLRRRTDLYEYAEALAYLPGSRTHGLGYIGRRCPQCSSLLVSEQCANGVSRWDEEDNFDEEADEQARIQALEFCSYCRYWRWHDFDVFRSAFEGVTHAYVGSLSKVREFSGQLPDGFVSEFAQWLRRDESRWSAVEPRSLERLVRDVMRSVHDPCEAIHVGQPNDGGVDVVLIESNGTKWVIQVKRRGNSQVGEPVATVRNLLGTMVLKNSSHGMIFSTADHFTFLAHQAVAESRKSHFHIELADKGKLNRLLDAVLPEKPWLPFLQERYPEVAPEFEAAMEARMAERRTKLTTEHGNATN